jgi:histone H3/H4
MKRFCQNVALKLDKKIRLKRAALYAFQGAAETFLVDFFSGEYKCDTPRDNYQVSSTADQILACNDARNHAKRLTLQVKDMNMVWTLDSAMAGK